jgi:asparagine synthase (glutamine-hydrolysing)
MCGLLGFIDKKRRLSDWECETLWRQMISTIEHRGGDANGAYRLLNVTLAHTRLRILDINTRSDQPFYSNQLAAVLTFNGQIFNHLELRSQLCGHFSYETSSDTETLLYSYARWGPSCVELLRGMFAFAIFEPHDFQVTLGVDRLGIKPLYYLNNDDWFAWSSEVKALLLVPGVRALLDRSAIHEFLVYRSVSGNKTMFDGIRRMLPSQMLIYDVRKDTTHEWTYWRPESIERTDDKSTTVDEVRNVLFQSVKEHVVADVPFGIQLSGGLDSTLVAHFSKATISHRDELHSFCIGPTDPGWAEFEYARCAASAIGTIHHEVRFNELMFSRLLENATLHHDEPLNHPNTVPMMLLSQEARGYVKVLISGEGADELFGGYRRYMRFLESQLSVGHLMESNKFNSVGLARSVVRGVGDLLPAERMAVCRAIVERDAAQQLTLYDIHFYLPGLLLRQDKMGMAANLEVRVPYLDHRVIELALKLPDEQKITTCHTKVILRAAAKGLIPEAIIDRAKRGFGLPISQWLKNQTGLGRLFQQIIIDEQRRDFLNYVVISQLYQEHRAGNQDNSDILWPLLALEVWCRCFLDDDDLEELWAPAN